MRTVLDERPLPRVLPQVERGQHAEGRHHDAHDEDHHDGPEDGREDTAFGVGLARIVGHEGPQTGRVVSESWPAAHGVREVHVNDLGEGYLLLLAPVGRSPRDSRSPASSARPAGPPPACSAPGGSPSLPVRPPPASRLVSPGQFETAKAEPDLLLGVIDDADSRPSRDRGSRAEAGPLRAFARQGRSARPPSRRR